MEKKLYKSNNKMVYHVCAGIAEYFKINLTRMRIGWILFCAVGGSRAVAYVIAALVMAGKPE